MTAVAIASDFEQEVYDRLLSTLGVDGTYTYVAEYWQDFLELFGYTRNDQSRVSHAIAALQERGLVSRESVRARSGYQARRRANYPKPRQVVVRVLR